MKKSILTLLVFLVCAIQTTAAYEYFTIYFSDGTKSEAFYATDVDSICYSKLSLDSIAYDDWQVQEIYTCDSVYRYPLDQIDSLSFKDVAIEKVSKDIGSVSATIAPIFAKCNSIAEISQYLQEILQIDGVEDAWTDNQSLFVKIRDWGITTFSYPPILENTSNVYSLTRSITKTLKVNGRKSPYKACIVNQVGKDELRDNSAIIKNLKQYFDEINIECDSINPLPLFYKTDIYDYDLIFLINHGDYDGQSHWLCTGEEILCTGDVNNISEKDFANLETLANNLFKLEHPDCSPNMLSIGWIGEIREGVKVVVWYVKVSEHYIASSKRDFSGKNTAIFNVACQSLKDNYSLGSIFLNNKKAKCYLGYTESNDIGPKGGEWFIKNLINGSSAYGARKAIPNEWCEQTIDGVSPQLKLLPERGKQTYEYRILNPETLASEKLNDNNKSSVRVKGQILMLNNSNVVDKFSYGFQYSANSDMSQAKSIEAQGNYDSSTLYMNWEATLEDSDIKPNTTYYYRAYMNDGYSNCFGEVKSFTTKGGNAEAYCVWDEASKTATYYYDGMRESRGGTKLTNDKLRVNTSAIKVVFDSSFSEYYPKSISFDSCKNLQIINNIEYMNTDSLKSMSAMFAYCSSLTNLDLSSFNTSNVSDMGDMFSSCSSLTSVNLSSFNISNVTDMSLMFSGCSSLTSLNLSHFNTSNVTDMSFMFSGCSSLTSLHLSHFNTSNVTDMSSMFSGCSSLTSLNLSHFNTSNVTDMSLMFSGCSSLTSLNLSHFDTSNVTDMSSMFYGCNSLEKLDLSSFDTSNVEEMRWMFFNCSSLEELDVSHFSTGKVTNMYSMFCGCRSLKELDISHFNTEKVTDMYQMFRHCSLLENLDLSNFNPCNVTNMSQMFDGCESLSSLLFSNFNTTNVTTMKAMFGNCKSLKELNLSSFITSNVTSMQDMFKDCSSLTSVNLENFDTSNVTDMSRMFNECNSLKSLDLSSFNTSKVTNMGSMFDNCSTLTSLDLSNFDMSNVEIGYTFRACKSLKTLDMSNYHASEMNTDDIKKIFILCESLTTLNMSNFNVPKMTDMSCFFRPATHPMRHLKSINLSNANMVNVTNMYKMFCGCDSLQEVNLSGCITSNVTSMAFMFSGCRSLKNLNISSFNTEKVETMARMFEICKSLTSLDLSFFNTSNLKTIDYMFFGCSSLQYLNIDGFRTSDDDNYLTFSTFLSGCESLETLDMNYFTASEATSSSRALSGLISLKNLNISHFYAPKMKSFLFDERLKSLEKINISYLDAPELTGLGFNGIDPPVKEVDMSNCNAPKLRNIPFQLESITKLNMSNFNASFLTSCGFGLFTSSMNLEILDMSNFYAPNLIYDASWGFLGRLESLQKLDISNFYAPNITNMSRMFYGLKSLTEIKLDNFPTENITSMAEMFSGCSSLQYLDLKGFNTAQVKSMLWMFRGCSSLKTIFGNDWRSSMVKNSSEMFEGCTKLVGGSGTKLGENVYYEYVKDSDGKLVKTKRKYRCYSGISSAHIDGGKDDPGLFTAK